MMKIKLMKKLTDKGFPTHSKRYAYAHEEADKVEKKKYPSGYKKLRKEERGISKHELIGKNTRSGKIEVESKFKKNKSEIALHERTENNILRKKK